MYRKKDSFYTTLEPIGMPPNWMVIKGIPIITGILLVIIFIISQISYNDVVEANVVVTSSIPPVYIAPKINGVLDEIRVESGDVVKKDEILAVLQNTSDTEQVLEILNKIKGKYDTINEISTLFKIFPQNYNLGQIQLQYNNFVSSYQQYINFTELQREFIKGKGLKDQVLNQEYALNNQKRKLLLTQRRGVLATEQFEKQQTLFNKGVISKSELESFEEKLLQSEQNTQNTLQQLSLLSVQTSKMKSAYVDSDLNLAELENNYLSDLWGAKQTLLSSINIWKNNYLLISPTEGKISIFDIWERFQNVQQDDFIFSIVPLDYGKLLGKMNVPIRNSGEITQKNKVIIKLDNYPFREWGSLKGEILHISDVPKKGEENYYSMYVSIKSLETSFGKKIAFKQEMTGKAEIILKKKSLLKRIFYQFKSTWE